MLTVIQWWYMMIHVSKMRLYYIIKISADMKDERSVSELV